MHNFKSVGFLAATSLLLAGCAAIPTPSVYELSNPSNTCQGSDIFLELSEPKPMFNNLVQDETTLSVVDANGQLVSQEALAKIVIEYRMGFFGDSGFEMISPQAFSVRSPYHPGASPSPSPLPSNEAFLDIFWDVEGDPPSDTPVPDGDQFFSIPLEGPQASGTLFNFFGDSEATFLAGVFPGAFLAQCLDTEEYVAAVPMFPNTSVDEVAPDVVETDPETAVVDFSALFSGPGGPGFVFMQIAEIENQVFSSNSITQRWLNNASFGGANSAITGGALIFRLDSNGSTSETMDPMPNGDYQAIVSYLTDLDNDSIKMGTAYYDVAVFNGNYSFVRVVPENTPTIRSSNPIPRVDGSSQVTSFSTKGFRELSITGENLTAIHSASIGGKNAPVVSSSGSLLKLRLPALSAGTYSLNLKHSGGEIKNARSVLYVPAKRFSSLKIGMAKPRASWLKQSNLVLAKNRNVLQVDCVVTLASGVSNKALRTKATSICKSLAKTNPGIRTVTRTVVGKDVRTALVLKFWG